MFDEKALEGIEGWDTTSEPKGMGAYAQPLPGMASSTSITQAVAEAPVPALPGYGRVAPAMHRPMMPQRMVYPPGHPLAGQTLEWLEGKESGQSGTMRGAGVAAVLLAGSFGLGVALGGPWGAIAGVLLAGTALNGYRAQKFWGDQDQAKNFEAVSSAVFAAGGLLAGGYAAYQAYQSKQAKTSKAEKQGVP